MVNTFSDAAARSLAFSRSIAMIARRQHVVSNDRASAGQPFGETGIVAGRPAAARRTSMIRTGVPAKLGGWSSRKGESARNRIAPARSSGRVRRRAAAMMAPIEKPMAMGALVRLYRVLAPSMKSARIVAREVMSPSSIDGSGRR
jgi:hypothetical protein